MYRIFLSSSSLSRCKFFQNYSVNVKEIFNSVAKQRSIYSQCFAKNFFPSSILSFDKNAKAGILNTTWRRCRSFLHYSQRLNYQFCCKKWLAAAFLFSIKSAKCLLLGCIIFIDRWKIAYLKPLPAAFHRTRFKDGFCILITFVKFTMWGSYFFQ